MRTGLVIGLVLLGVYVVGKDVTTPPSRPGEAAKFPEVQLTPTVDTRPVTIEDIRQLQKQLNDLAYNAGTADGIMGPKTAAAIRQFERENGRPETGNASRTILQDVDGRWSGMLTCKYPNINRTFRQSPTTCANNGGTPVMPPP